MSEPPQAQSAERPAAEIRALNQRIVQAADPQIRRIVATVDALDERGQAEQVIVPLRHRLAALRPPHPLRFARLLFHPLDPLIVPAQRWRPGQPAIPRTALRPIAEHVRQIMGADAGAIQAQCAGRTTADIAVIVPLGRLLWPEAARVLADPLVPKRWHATELGEANYRPLASLFATLLAEVAGLDTLCAETAGGLLPPRADIIAAMLTRVASADAIALPMMLSLLLNRLPQAADSLAAGGLAAGGLTSARAGTTLAPPTTIDQAAGLLLGQLDQQAGIERQLAAGTLADAGAAARRIATLLSSIGGARPEPRRRDRLRALRQRLDAGCRERFTAGLRDELLAPLQDPDAVSGSAHVAALEKAARGLRVLAIEGRAIGGGFPYDQLPNRAAEAINSASVRNKLSLNERLRLIEILCGPDAALAMLDQPA